MLLMEICKNKVNGKWSKQHRRFWSCRSHQISRFKYCGEFIIPKYSIHFQYFWAGAIASLFCTITVTVFFSSTHFLKQNKLLALLAVADLCSSLGILTLGLMRKALYERIVETSQVPLETIWSCASKPFVYLRLIGVIVPPWIVLWISSERFMAVLTPQIYCRHIFNRSRFVLPIILSYSVLSLGFVYFVAWSKRNDPVEAYCGRRKIFTKYYSIYTFLVDIFSYSIALVINCATACRLARLQSHLKSRGCIQRQVNRVHYMLIISLFATLTVTVPNTLFLSSILFHKWMHFDLTDPSNWMITAKCAANFFIFLLFMEEFRVRIYEILGCISRNPSRERQYEVSALGLAMTNRRRTISVSVVGHWDQRRKPPDDSFFVLADMLLNKTSNSNNEKLAVGLGRIEIEERITRRSANF